jgi:hypothetical protein
VLILANFWQIFEKNCAQIIWAIFFRTKCAQLQKVSPKWQNFAESGHIGLSAMNLTFYAEIIVNFDSK